MINGLHIDAKRVLLIIVLIFLIFFIFSDKKYSEYMSEISVQYNTLALDDKMVYKKLCKQIDTSHQFDIKKSEMLSDDDYWRLLSILANEDYHYFYVRNLQVKITDGLVSVKYDTDMSDADIKAHLNSYDTVIKNSSKETADLSERSAFEYFYKLVREADPVIDGGNSTNAIGCLVEKQANCQGYAKALRQLCLTRKIPCILLCGSYEGENHMWNMVYIDNQWYYSDPANGDSTPLFDELSDSYIIY